jgi:nucleoid-associated protein YgaU
MRAWTTSACVALAWTLMLAALAAAGLTGSARPAQANTRTTHSTTIILTSIHNAAPAALAASAAPAVSAVPAALAAPVTPTAPGAPTASAAPAAAPAVTGSNPATSPVTRYLVQPGDTLSAIAARFGIQGGWPPLYASNLKAIGWNPGVLHPGTVLVLPGPARVRYTIAAGDTLSGIAAGLGIAGGWPALYAANRPVIGSDPDALQPGTVLKLPRPAAAPATSGVTPSWHSAPPPAPAPAPVKHHRHPVTGAAVAGMPSWLKTMLVALGLLILVALLTEPVLAALRRRQKAALRAGPATAGPADSAGQLRSLPATPDKTSIVLADHDRLVVTCNKTDETVYVLRPPGEDPRAILRVARLVLPEGPYWELARQLGVPAVEPVE